MPEPIHVLLVEDDPGDVTLTRESLRECKVKVNLWVVKDGEEAMQFLRKAERFSGALTPDLVLLDLNLPRKDGREVLAEIKSDPGLKNIPVVVLTTSNAEDDIGRTYALGANCYITKPIGLEQFARVVQGIEEFWFSIVKLPPRKPAGAPP